MIIAQRSGFLQKKCMEDQFVVAVHMLRLTVFVIFLIVVLTLVSDGVTEDDMYVLTEITEFSNKKNGS